MKSMTGYGRAEGTIGGMTVTVEARSLNHRYQEVRLSFPNTLLFLEPAAEARARGRIARGRLEMSLRLSAGASFSGRPRLDRGALVAWQKALSELTAAAGLEERPSLSLLSGLPGVLVQDEVGLPVDMARAELERILDAALDGLCAMREREGEALARDIRSHLSNMDGLIAELTRLAPQEIERQRSRLAQNLRSLAGEAGISQDRVGQELSLLAERLDVSEELSRLAAHMGHFRSLMDSPASVGRELDFVLQEMNREANTLASKLRAESVAPRVVALRAEIERVREQVQNVE
ncbi:MAG: YicC family protein [Myxococcales bacterium]|nr:YicC family protein [Myxococcales bacterium]